MGPVKSIRNKFHSTSDAFPRSGKRENAWTPVPCTYAYPVDTSRAPRGRVISSHAIYPSALSGGPPISIFFVWVLEPLYVHSFDWGSLL
ncbi:unnamed protein product [Penicillium camemberti]|uniref:Str. FM013 n=1 Tax=Penicillium camemberti (strain FM 013) TaxID=1429867 RepID=A0A0G4NW27_PENC3|nr:unnamed protein product [Penicillium camemberti]